MPLAAMITIGPCRPLSCCDSSGVTTTCTSRVMASHSAARQPQLVDMVPVVHRVALAAIGLFR